MDDERDLAEHSKSDIGKDLGLERSKPLEHWSRYGETLIAAADTYKRPAFSLNRLNQLADILAPEESPAPDDGQAGDSRSEADK